VAYSIHALPILSFVGQLCAAPPEGFEAEDKALHAMSPWPGNWCTVDDLHFMGDAFGQSRNFPSLAHMCSAAQKRVVHWENITQGGLGIESQFTQLQNSLRQSDHLDRYCKWFKWYCSGPVAILCQNSEDLARCGLAGEELLRQAGWESIQEDDKDTCAK